MKKFVIVNDNINNESQIRNLIIIPFKEINNLMEIFHKITGNKILTSYMKKYYQKGYHWNNIIDSCKDFLKNR